MKVILQDNVQKLGKAGDIVEIKRGYFRNFLEPRGLALLATKGTLKKREEDMEAFRRKAANAHDAAVALAERINSLPPIVLGVKAGETGKLYGKVTNKEVCLLIEKQLGQEIDKRLVKTNQEINQIGSYKAHVKLTPEVQAEVRVEVIPEGSVFKDKEAAAAPAESTEEPKTEAAEAEAEENQEENEEEE